MLYVFSLSLSLSITCGSDQDDDQDDDDDDGSLGKNQGIFSPKYTMCEKIVIFSCTFLLLLLRNDTRIIIQTLAIIYICQKYYRVI